jgi:hypothetical protein
MSTPRGRQIKTDQGKLLTSPETAYTYQIIEDTPTGRILQNALEALDAASGRGTIAVLEADGQTIARYTSAYISPTEPTAGIDIEAINEGDLWFDTTDNVIKRYNGTIWVIKGAAYL